MNFLDKYPRTKAMMEKTGMTLDQLYQWVEKEYQKHETIIEKKEIDMNQCSKILIENLKNLEVSDMERNVWR